MVDVVMMMMSLVQRLDYLFFFRVSLLTLVLFLSSVLLRQNKEKPDLPVFSSSNFFLSLEVSLNLSRTFVLSFLLSHFLSSQKPNSFLPLENDKVKFNIHLKC